MQWLFNYDSLINFAHRHRVLDYTFKRHKTYCTMCIEFSYYEMTNFYATHTHPFNNPLSGTTRVSRYQKGKTNLDFTEARDSEWQWHQLGKSAPRSKQITTPAPHHSVFYRPDSLPAAQPTNFYAKQVTLPFQFL